MAFSWGDAPMVFADERSLQDRVAQMLGDLGYDDNLDVADFICNDIWHNGLNVSLRWGDDWSHAVYRSWDPKILDEKVRGLIETLRTELDDSIECDDDEDDE